MNFMVGFGTIRPETLLLCMNDDESPAQAEARGHAVAVASTDVTEAAAIDDNKRTVRVTSINRTQPPQQTSSRLRPC